MHTYMVPRMRFHVILRETPNPHSLLQRFPMMVRLLVPATDVKLQTPWDQQNTMSTLKLDVSSTRFSTYISVYYNVLVIFMKLYMFSLYYCSLNTTIFSTLNCLDLFPVFSFFRDVISLIFTHYSQIYNPFQTTVNCL